MSHPAEKFPWRMGVAVLHDAAQLMKEFGVAQETAPDRRKAARFPLHIPIRYQLNGDQSDWDAAETVNVSQGGVRFMTMQKDIKPGAQVDLMIKLPGVSQIFQLIGTIVWAKPATQKGFVMECGVVFGEKKKQ